MATLSLVLDTRRILKNQTFPLVFRLRLSSKFTDIPTGIKLKLEEFDSKTNSIINQIDTNIKVEQLKTDYLKRFRDFMVENPLCNNVIEIKDYVLGISKSQMTIQEYWNHSISELKKTGRLGNAKVNECSLSVISKIINLNVPFNKLSYKSLLDIESTLLQRGVKNNSIAVYMRALRKICNDAIKLDLVPFEWYPFRKFDIKKDKTTPRVLSIEELRAYFSLDLSPSSTYYKSYLIGKLIFMMRGINLRDLLSLSHSNLKGDRIVYKRSKTGTMYSIKLTEDIQAILSLFSSNKTLLGILDDNVPQTQFIDYYQQKRKVINSHLRKIGKQINSREELSTYCFRYSFANVCKQLGYSKDLIAEALGHQYGSLVTGIYLEQYDLALVDEMTEKVISAIS